MSKIIKIKLIIYNHNILLVGYFSYKKQFIMI